jgi:hypothetical protein
MPTIEPSPQGSSSTTPVKEEQEEQDVLVPPPIKIWVVFPSIVYELPSFSLLSKVSTLDLRSLSVYEGLIEPFQSAV